MTFSFIVVAGLLCVYGHCIELNDSVEVIITDNQTMINEACLRNVSGCADLANRKAYISKHSLPQTEAIIFHELLHFEYWDKHHDPTHPDELLARDNSFRKQIGVLNGYCSPYITRYNGYEMVGTENIAYCGGMEKW